MKWFDNLTFRWKLFLNFAVSGGILIAAIVFCLLQIRSVGSDTEEISKNWLPSVKVAAEISQYRLRYRVRSLEYMLPGSDAEKEKIEKSLDELDASLSAAFKKYEPLISSEGEKKLFQEAVTAAASYKASVVKAVALVKSGQADEAQELRKTAWVKDANSLRDKTDALQKLNAEGADKAASSALSDVAAAIKGGLIALVCGVLIALAASYWIAQRLANGISTAVHSARLIARGDLTGTLPEVSRDELGKLNAAIGEMQQSLRSAMQETTGSAGDILSASKQLNQAVGQMEQAAQIQSSAASAIAASVEELTVSITVVADSTSEASRLANASDQQAASGNTAIETLVSEIAQVATVINGAAEQIAHLKDESEKISAIVSVIKDIADQTNLLALNAAIEAARAGEHGRGFAVVADEVRKLSERTALSTREIVAMVNAIQHSTGEVVAEVTRGVSLVDSSVLCAGKAGDAIATLQKMARQLSKVVGDVDMALREQTSASTEVARKIEDIASQTEETSAIARETSRASDSMAKTAHDMQGLVARFRI